jgi:primosomal protein N' (replication factor Y)
VQRVLVQQLLDAKTAVATDRLISGSDSNRDALRRLEKKGVIVRCEIERKTPQITNKTSVTLTTEQQQAVAQLLKLDDFKPALLDGITGSGKTEVYIQIAEKMIAQGKQVLVLVPEISLTPQLMGRFINGISGRCVVLHSGLNAREREMAWLDGLHQQADLILGTRSAILTSLAKPGLIIVDEEHDLSFKQQEGFRYSARDAAVMKAKLHNIPIILGSATPSLETLSNALLKKYTWIKLRERPGKAMPAQIHLIDIRSQRLNSGISSELFQAIRTDLDVGNQVIIFLNRRGYAPQLTCSACGWIAECKHCDARMTWHQGINRLWCHHCGHQSTLPSACPGCNTSESLTQQGQGTEKVEETLASVFHDTPVIRIDRDTTRRKGSLQASLDRVHQGGPALLVGTQMLAKGHDFPHVTLVGILNIDGGMLNPDFRAAERTAQLFLQVSGRSGRAEKPGRVFIQTRHPEHPLLQILVKQGYEAFAQQELHERKQAEFPPYTFQSLLRAESTNTLLVQEVMQQVRAACNQLIPDIECWGPTPALLERKAGHFRWNLLLQCANRGQLQTQLNQLLKWIREQKISRKIRWAVDVDPQEIF